VRALSEHGWLATLIPEVHGGDIRLRHDSPLVDRGDPAFQAAGALDRDGHPRLRDGDGAGGSRADIGALEYQRSAPVATATATPAAADPGQVVAFDGVATDADPGETLTYQWAFDDGATAVGATAYHAFASAGPHTATLTVSDPSGVTDTAQVAVNVNPPASPGPAPAFAGVRLMSTKLAFGGRVIRLKLSCPAATVGHCSGRATLAARPRRTSTRRVTLGRAGFSIAPGSAARTRVRVTRAGRRLLRQTPRMRGRAVTAARDGTGRSKVIVTGVTIRRRDR
jgi:PKD domain